MKKNNLNKLIDIGSGAGFPGIFLSLYLENKNIVLSEVNKKKLDFLKKTIDELELKNVKIFDPSQYKITKSNSLITCRAFSSLLKIKNESCKYQRKTNIIAYKGKREKINEEIIELKKIYQKINIEIEKIEVPFIEAERNLVILS